MGRQSQRNKRQDLPLESPEEANDVQVLQPVEQDTKNKSWSWLGSSSLPALTRTSREDLDIMWSSLSPLVDLDLSRLMEKPRPGVFVLRTGACNSVIYTDCLVRANKKDNNPYNVGLHLHDYGSSRPLL
ncbi:hypothetical protein RRG08_017661 [Elysia crispata]|uniref:Uncharacterized protein n=1 Tax=Elysia crispata TaxID=231223 RepID=A0AAE0ZBJ5_9GAST|nr:hypothetical protein RRG08_017661 [Elysia crispata]